ncbi:MAG: 6-aminohexanoate hydrolase [Rhizobium sp.]|nr:6-aminohexanoate hydrolase [Rhizobium sp.]
MRIIGRILKWLALTVVVLVVGAAGWLYFFPPELFRVGTAYAAKIVCSNYNLAHRDPAQVLADDVQAPGHPLLKYINIDHLHDDSFGASLFGYVAEEIAVNRDGLGCAVAPGHDLEAVRKVRFAKPVEVKPESDFEWPLGDEVSLEGSARVQALIADPSLAGPGMRGIVVVKNGRLVAETYAPGFTAGTPLMGWSMTKTVTGALVATRVAAGKLKWDQDHLFPEWTDDRARIKIADLMAMRSGLNLEESYGDVNDVTRMLFLEPDQAKFVADHGLEAQPGARFEYTTGSAVLLSRVWMNTFPDQLEALAYPRNALFGPIGMRSAVMETDAAGTFSGGSLMYATARDWARFGLLLANKGDWNGVQVLPQDFAEMVATSTPVSGGLYSEALTWKSVPRSGQAQDVSTLPSDTFWARGHDGQSIAVIPSEGLVVVRLGLTPSKLGYRPEMLVEKVMDAAREPVPDAPAENARPTDDAQPSENAIEPQ